MTDVITRRRMLAGLAALATGQAVAQDQASQEGGHQHDRLAAQFGGAFTLTDHTGRRVSDGDFRDRFMLIYFGFTRCTDTCPIDLPIIAQALDSIGPLADKLVPLFITVDPGNDTPPVMATYVAAFHPRLIGLTGSEAEIAATAKAYKVHRRKLTQPHHGAGEYAVDHGSLTYLMGPDGRFVTLLPHNSGAVRLAAILRKYLA
jgi:protein SCO1/2